VFKNPLELYDDLVERDGIQECFSKFLNDAEMLDAIFTNDERTEFRFAEKDNWGNDAFIVENFNSYLNKEFIKAFNYFCLNISSQLSFIASAKDQKDKVDFYSTNLDRLLSLSLTNIKGQEITQRWIQRAKSYLNEKFSGISTTSNRETTEILSYEGVDFFEYKPNNSTLHDLYNKLLQLKFFEDDVTYPNFRNWITASTPHLHPKIEIRCSKQEAAYILHRLKHQFKEMNDVRTVKFNLFCYRNGVKLIAGNLYRNRSAFINNPLNVNRITEIDEELPEM